MLWAQHVAVVISNKNDKVTQVCLGQQVKCEKLSAEILVSVYKELKF